MALNHNNHKSPNLQSKTDSLLVSQMACESSFAVSSYIVFWQHNAISPGNMCFDRYVDNGCFNGWCALIKLA